MVETPPKLSSNALVYAQRSRVSAPRLPVDPMLIDVFLVVVLASNQASTFPAQSVEFTSE